MQAGALQPYEGSLVTAAPIALCTPDGQAIDLDIDRWLGAADLVDQTVLARCVGPVLDVGCGPGRFVAALLEQHVPAMGVDIAETAVALTRSRGLPALHRCVFTPIPGEGRWATVLLMDGNIGIDGNPRRLLARVRDLLAPGGRVLVETDADDYADRVLTVRFCQRGDPVGPAFTWAQVGWSALHQYASTLGYRAADRWTAGGRTFVELHRGNLDFADS